MKASPRLALVIGGLLIAMIAYGSGEIVPAANAYQAEMRLWLVGRATGIAALLLVTMLVLLGILLSHPEQARWKQAKRLYPLHELLWIFSIAFVTVHAASLAADSYAGVGWQGAIVPGLSDYRTPAVALGTIAAYALVITGITARFTKVLPSGWWLKLHRLAAVVLALGWSHSVLAGTDTAALGTLYAGIGFSIGAAALTRYWIVRRRTPRVTRVPSATAATPIPISTETPHA
jgi:predicted ferric reductase